MYRATYVINAVGLLSAINFPNLPGLETFEGETIHTAAWPEGKDLAGRRVGVIGTGSTGQQVITALAPEGRAPDRFRPDPAVLGPGRQSPRDRRSRSTR